MNDRLVQTLLDKITYLEKLNEEKYNDMKEMVDKFAIFANSYADMCVKLMNLQLLSPEVTIAEDDVPMIDGGELDALTGSEEE